MKKSTSAAALVAAAALVVATTLPAQAATSAIITVPDGTGGVAVDVGSSRVYVGTTPTSPSPEEEWNSSAGVALVDVQSQKVVRSVTLLTLLSYAIGAGVADVEVSPTSRDLWVLVGLVTTGSGCSATLYQLDKTSLTTVRHYALGCTRKVEVDPTSRTVYLTESPFYDDRGDDAQPTTKATVVAVDGRTGTVRKVDVPSPTTGVFNVTEQYLPTSIALNLRHRRLYVVGQGVAWKYSTRLTLRSTTALAYPTDADLSAAANPVTDRVYVTDGTTLTEISGRTGDVTRTAAISGYRPVVDIRANLLYLDTTTVRLSTLRSVGDQPRAVAAVDPLTRTRYSLAQGQMYVDR